MSSYARMLRRPTAIMAGAFLAMAVLSTAFAQESDPVAELSADLDRAWLMITAFLVFFMQAGFAMVEAGFVRSKNVTNILMKNMLDCCLGSSPSGQLVGLSPTASGRSAPTASSARPVLPAATSGDYASWIFQFAFAATAATIVSGAMAERTAVQRLPVLHRLHLRDRLPGRRALGLGRRRLAHRLQRTTRSAPTATSTSPVPASSTWSVASPVSWARSSLVLASASSANAAGQRDPRTQHQHRCPRHVHPLVRLVRVQPRLNARPERWLRDLAAKVAVNTTLAAGAGASCHRSSPSSATVSTTWA